MSPILTIEPPGTTIPSAEHNSRRGLFAGWFYSCGPRLYHLVMPSNLTTAETERIAGFLDYATRRKFGG